MAVDMFLKLKDIKGESQDQTYKEEIDVLSWSWGMSQSGTTHMGSGGGSGKVSVQDLSITKYVDAASSDLHLCCATGKHIDNGLLVVRKAGDKPLEYLKIKMEEIIVTSVSSGGTGSEDRVTEHVTLNFARYQFDYVVQDEKGNPGKKPTHRFDVAKNVKI
jgi:type VI secretion system secreted protein Hcp